jgi:hypothetical protein
MRLFRRFHDGVLRSSWLGPELLDLIKNSSKIVVYAAKFIADSSLPSTLSPLEDSPSGKRPKGATDGWRSRS